MTGRHEGSDTPHGHAVSLPAIKEAVRGLQKHLHDCARCRTARIESLVWARDHGHDIMAPLDSTDPEMRDRFERETSGLYCDEGRALLMKIGEAGMGRVVPMGGATESGS